jgi:hypothetical protein
MDKIILICDACKNKWTQDTEGLGYVNWMCPTCKKDDDVFTIEYIEENPSNEPIIMGRGGCGRTG